MIDSLTMSEVERLHANIERTSVTRKIAIFHGLSVTTLSMLARENERDDFVAALIALRPDAKQDLALQVHTYVNAKLDVDWPEEDVDCSRPMTAASRRAVLADNEDLRHSYESLYGLLTVAHLGPAASLKR